MLHIWLPRQQSEIFVWQETQKTWQGFDNWQSIAHSSKDKSACLYFSSTYVLQVDDNLSAKQLKQLGETGQQYLFEDICLGAVDKLLVKQCAHAGHQRLYACSKQDIEQWQNAAFIVGITVQALLPDFLLLPTDENDPNKLYLYHDQHTTLARYSPTLGNAVSYLPLFLQRIEPTTDLIIVDDIRSSQEILAELTCNLDELTHLTIHSTAKILEPVERPLRHQLNFALQKTKSKQSPYLTAIVIIALLALTVQILVDGMSGQQLKKANTKVKSGIQKQFATWFPQQRLNQRVKLQPQLAPYLLSSEQDSDVMTSYFLVSKVIQQSKTSAQELLIDEKGIKIKLFAVNRSQVSLLVKQLTQQGINAEIGNISNVSEGLKDIAQDYKLIAEIRVSALKENS